VIDRSGEVLALGTAHPIAADSDAVVYHALEEFTTGVRAVFRDPNDERSALKRAYAYLPGDNVLATPTVFLEPYMARNDPRLLSEQFSRTAEIVSILKLPQKSSSNGNGGSSTWRLRWRETTYPVGTALGETSEWEAFATVRLHPKRTLEAFDPNPFGIYIDHLMGHGFNPVTGDFSKGAAGMWIENGKKTYPVDEATVSALLTHLARMEAMTGHVDRARGLAEEALDLAGQTEQGLLITMALCVRGHVCVYAGELAEARAAIAAAGAAVTSR